MTKLHRIFLAWALCCCSQPLWATEQPNVVIFFIDDLGYKDLGCYGSAFYETPAIDRLAKRSVLFTDFYSANPVCSPTRAALMTGKAPQRVGITQWIPQPNELHLPHSELTIAEAFRQAGYETGYIGKWHLGEKDDQLPTGHGFNWMKCVNRAGQPASYFHPFSGRKRNGVGYWDVPDLESSKEGDYLTDRMTDHALGFLDANRSKPFFLCFGHYAVHTPIQSPRPLIEKYLKKRKKLYGETEEPRMKEINNAITQVRQDRAAYAAMVENLDTNVAHVLEKLDQLGLRENTIVVFTSDNGGLTTTRRAGPTSVRPLRAGKGWTFEGGIRIPMLISWPKKIQSAKVSVPGITMDIYPTLLELAGLDAQPNQHLDGLSLATALYGSTSERLKKRFLAWTYPHKHGSGHTPSHAIRHGSWKLIHLEHLKRFELYNLELDISESENLMDQFPQKADALKAKLQTWLKETTPASKPKTKN